MVKLQNTFIKHLIEVAEYQWGHAYAPYSKFQVGAAVVSDQGVFGGCNVENASYGATICAERTAILSAVSRGSREILSVVVVTHAKGATPPCALCLQMLAEFCKPSADIILSDGRRVLKRYKFKDLLKEPFGPGKFKRLRGRA